MIYHCQKCGTQYEGDSRLGGECICNICRSSMVMTELLRKKDLNAELAADLDAIRRDGQAREQYWDMRGREIQLEQEELDRKDPERYSRAAAAAAKVEAERLARQEARAAKRAARTPEEVAYDEVEEAAARFRWEQAMKAKSAKSDQLHIPCTSNTLGFILAIATFWLFGTVVTFGTSFLGWVAAFGIIFGTGTYAFARLAPYCKPN